LPGKGSSPLEKKESRSFVNGKKLRKERKQFKKRRRGKEGLEIGRKKPAACKKLSLHEQ